MDIEELKADFEQSECFKRLEHVAQYTFFEFGAYIRRTDVPDEAEKKHGKMILALILSWSAWKEAKTKAQAAPEAPIIPKYSVVCLEPDSMHADIAINGECFSVVDIIYKNDVLNVNDELQDLRKACSKIIVLNNHAIKREFLLYQVQEIQGKMLDQSK